MKKKMRGLWRDGERWFDVRTLRERAMLACAAAALLVGGWTLFSFDPGQTERNELRSEREALEIERSAIQIKQGEILARHQRDPNDDLRTRRGTLLIQIAASDEKIRAYTAGMIGPSEMAALLESMLRKTDELEFIRLEHLGPRELRPEGFDGDVNANTGVFLHSMELVFKGSYLAALRTLRALEALDGQFFWEGMEYETLEHPDGTATLRTFTLSTDENWIGA